MRKVVKNHRTPQLSGSRGELLGSSPMQLRGPSEAPKSPVIETEQRRRGGETALG